MISKGKMAAMVLAVAAALATAPQVHAGPWTKSLGELYVKVGEGFFFSDSYRDSDGQIVTGDNEYLGATTSVYFEVGVWKGLHVWGYLPHVVGINDNLSTMRQTLNAGGGDALLGLQYTPPFKLPLPVAAKLEFKVPFYDVAEVPSGFAAAGDGQLDVTFWLSAGGSIDSLKLFFFGEVGYRHRTEHYVGDGSTASYVDGFGFFASVGYKLFGKYIVALNSGGIIPFEEDDFTKGYVTIGPALYIPVYKGLALEASFDPMIYTNRNASPGMGFSVGVSYAR